LDFGKKSDHTEILASTCCDVLYYYETQMSHDSFTKLLNICVQALKKAHPKSLHLFIDKDLSMGGHLINCCLRSTDEKSKKTMTKTFIQVYESAKTNPIIKKHYDLYIKESDKLRLLMATVESQPLPQTFNSKFQELLQKMELTKIQ
jgi:hypothetical protein